MSVKIKVATFNIEHCVCGIDAVAELIKKTDPDIIGIQEVDYYNDRTPLDEPALLATKAGMPYYEFYKAIDFQGGEYGLMIMSKHKIIRSDKTRLETVSGEKRVLGHAEIMIGDRAVDFFTTHLSLGGSDMRYQQFNQINGKLAVCQDFFLTGDFNIDSFSEYGRLENCNPVFTQELHFDTFPGNGSCIDNIFSSTSLKNTRLGVSQGAESDHFLIWAEYEL